MKRSFITGCLMLAVWGAVGALTVESARAADEQPAFDRTVAPLLARRCLGCHNGADKKGGLDLTSAEGLAAGGDSGAVAKAGDLDESSLWQRVDAEEMPPKKPLSADEKTIIKSWIAAGAAWGTNPIDRFQFTSDSRAGYDWWSLGPIAPPALPTNGSSGEHPIDTLVTAKLAERGLALSPAADRRALIRRLSFDLLGLPPSPEEVAAFVADESAGAYEKLVDRLLASPHYGERWARHWLDVARFGESDGFEYDRLRPDAWRYRDWVVAALNQDLPYDEFARLQIAGDVLSPQDAGAVVATGFLVGGAHDSLIPAGDVMKLIMREDELEDLVGTVSQTFLGLTVNCARCHDHKFDPIRQTDYYRLASALAGIKRGPRDLPATKDFNLEAIKTELASVRKELEAIDGPIRSAILAERASGAAQSTAPSPIAHWDFTKDLHDQVGSLEVSLFGGARQTPEGLVLDGKTAYAQSALLERPLVAKTLEVWVQLANSAQRGGAPLSLQTPQGDVFDAIVFGEQQPLRWLAGSDFFRRTQRVDGTDETAAVTEVIHVAITYATDGTISLYRNGEPYGKPYKMAEPKSFAAGQAQFLFGLRHAPVAAGKLLAGTIRQASVYDRALSAEELAASAGAANRVVAEAAIVARLSSEQRPVRARLAERAKSLDAVVQRGPNRAFAVTPQTAPVVHRLERGNPLRAKEAVAPGGVQSLALSNPDFDLAENASDADRRVRLAQWITSARNPLFARVAVNRVWYHHFGAGLVETPNDFGFNGGMPSNPHLLDWLAGEFIRNGFHLKSLHRTIVTSAVYRQSSRPNPAAQKLDAGNRLLWRYSPRRLEAETVRDAVLVVSGQWNARMGGEGFRDFDLQNQANTMAYVPRDHEGPEFNRRSLYRTWARGARNPLLDTFDCPDSSVTAPLRGVTTTPLQALSLLNNSFVLRMADHFAARVQREAGSGASDQVRRAYQLAYGRMPSDVERASVEPFVARHGLPALCRVLLNANEFLYVE